MIKIRYKDVEKVCLSHLIKKVHREHRKIINGEAGSEHYKLLAYLSKLIGPSLIIELGTHYGSSSLAMAENQSSVIITYDIVDRFKIKKRHTPKNIIKKIKNIFNEREERMLLKADLIFLDTFHDGVFEKKVYDYLVVNNYKGLLLLDDILWSNEMISFWNKIQTKKYDLTEIGHGKGLGPIGEISGTGLVDFSNKIQIDKT